MKDIIIGKIRDSCEDVIRDRMTLVKILTVVVILLTALILRVHESSKADITIESSGPAEEYLEEEDSGYTEQTMYVDISGAVKNPGVYQVEKDTRLYQVIEMAGGLVEDADTDSVNRASFVQDGQKIIIPLKGESGSAGSSSALPKGTADNSLVNINTATADELKTLNGIGDVMAERIIEYREKNYFKSKEDIMSVNGIGSGTYNKIKDNITF